MTSSRSRNGSCFHLLFYFGLFVAFSGPSAGQTPSASPNLVTIDASLPGPPMRSLEDHLGSNRNPAGHVLSANSQYLTLDGRPWLPVMGEFHYSRFPEAEWEDAILQMKADGVQIVSAYVIWIHHEQTEGVFDWAGNKDIRRFAELCAKHGMYFLPRIGPWVHGEVRNGGLPDWVQADQSIRQNEPVYLKQVDTFYGEIGRQLKGLLWKDGGPVIGLQLENEYVVSGPGKGAEHILKLKQMALAAGLDVPLYTVTGWGSAAIPAGEVLPVFGGYPDAPWDSSPTKLPASEVYVFRFANRASGNMGAMGGAAENSAPAYEGTPFLTAEVGGGIQDTYIRRPVVSTDDVAAIAPVMLGSGANLLGYYMFHGGLNPDGGRITLQESQRTGYSTDLPVRSYDFQAPIGNDGQERASFRRLKLVHYFLNDFGGLLAPMAAHAPAALPKNASDFAVPRVAARAHGNSAFLFIENHVRGERMPARPGFAVSLKLPQGTMRVPAEPIELPSGAYGIWPVNLDVGGVRLRYSTAQPFKHLVRGEDAYYFFFTLPEVKAEFMLDGQPVLQASGFTRLPRRHATLLRATGADGGQIDLRGARGTTHLILFSRTKAEQVWKLDGPPGLALTDAQYFANGSTLELRSEGDPCFRLGLLGARIDGSEMQSVGKDGLFTIYTASVPKVDVQAGVVAEHPNAKRALSQMGPTLSWRATTLPMAPDDVEFASAATWKLSISQPPFMATFRNVLLHLDYFGDVARLEQNGRLLDDDFWNGAGWTVGLREVQAKAGQSLTLNVLPWPEQHPIFLEPEAALQLSSGLAAKLNKLEAVPEYGLSVKVSRIP